MKEEKDIRAMVDEDIALGKAVWAASSYDSEVMGELFYHLMERYQDEIEDFVVIQQELEKISIAVETLQLWSEQMLAKGLIDVDKYNELMNK